MRITNLLFGLFAAVLVFQSMEWLELIQDKVPARASDYSVTTQNTGVYNRGGTVRDEGHGVFYIHTGEKLAPSVRLKFTRELEVVVDLRIRSSAKPGKILFTATHNDRIVAENVVTNKSPSRIRLVIARGDLLKITADKQESVDADHGEIKIQIKDFDTRSQEFLAPFLWALLLILLVSRGYYFIGLGSYLVFLVAVWAEKLNYEYLPFDTIMGYSMVFFALAFLWVLFYQAGTKLLGKPLAVLLIALSALLLVFVPANFVVYLLSFTNTITQEVLYAVLQSDSREAYEYVSDFYPARYVVTGLLALAAIVVVVYLQRFKAVLPLPSSLLLFLTMVFTTLAVAQRESLRIPLFLQSAFSDYQFEVGAFKAALESRKFQDIEFVATKAGLGETYVVVIGESLSKKHMSLYGYPRDTTPLMLERYRRGEILRFDGAYSSHTHTTLVMQHSLTEANQYNQKDYVRSVSILEALTKANIETYWLTNQVIYGPFDTVTSVIASSADELVALNVAVGNTTVSQVYDEALVGELRRVLAEPTDSTRVIFVHLSGNHSSYGSRYPRAKYTRFKGPIDQGVLGLAAAKNEMVNSYDNSVLYNDFVVSSLVDVVQAHSGPSAFLYLSDHAEDVVGGLGHISANFNFAMTEIPMLAWLSPQYRDLYPKRTEHFASHTDELFSNDLLYDTLLGLVGVESDRYSQRYDLSAENYALLSQDAIVLNSRRKYDDASNSSFWQQKNAQHLIETNQSRRVFPHRVNSLAKLQEVWNNGIRSFEVDVRFGDDQRTTFTVGHHKGVMGVGFERFLESVDSEQIERVWLDFKNLNSKNYQQAMNRLAYLDEKFGLKDKLIVESGTVHGLFKSFREAGWHTSYYIPTTQVLDIAKAGDKDAVRALAQTMASQVAEQNVSAVSFDTRVYSFVEAYLEPMLTSDVVYHVWYGPDLADVEFEQKLQASDIVTNQRVKTVLVKYTSQFHL